MSSAARREGGRRARLSGPRGGGEVRGFIIVSRGRGGWGGAACTAAHLHYRFSFFSHTKTRIAQKIKPRQPTSAEPLTSEGGEGGVRGGEVGGGGRTEGRGARNVGVVANVRRCREEILPA